LDLEYAVSQGVHFLMANLIAYEVLRSLHEWKRVGGPSTKPAIVVLDEAHRFFPSEGTSAEEVELLADFIARVARLGRSRGLGIVFSTHSPKDVHRIVIQLSNTKVVFRSEREYLEMLDIPQEFTRILELAPDRVALMKSHVIRSGHALFKTAEPLLGHFDIATLLSLGKM
jgi:Predicted ATPase